MPEIRMPIGGGTPPTPASGEVSLYAKPDKRFYMQDDTGAEVKLLTNEATLTDISVTAPLTSTGGSSPTLAINAATTTAAGTMAGTDKLKLDQATNLNTANTIVRRDPLGNFTAGTITATQFNGPATSVDTIPSLSGDVTSNGVTNAVTLTPGIIVNEDISNSAAIAISKLAVDPLNRANHTGFQEASTLANLGTEIDGYLTSNASIVNAMISNSAAIDLSKLATNPLNRSNHTGSQTVSTLSDFSTEVNSQVGTYLTSNPITDANIAAGAAISLSKLAINPLDRANHTGTQLASTISDFNTAVDLALTPGNGIDITSGTVSALGTSNRIEVSGGTIDIASTYEGQSSINTVGIINNGTWNGNVIGIANGGTGAASTGGALNNLTTVETINSGTTLNDNDRIILGDAASSNLAIALPAATNVYQYTIKKTDNSANTITITPDPGDLIDGAANVVLSTQYEYVRIVSDGTTNWFIISG